MTAIARAYRHAIPRSIRAPLWEARSAIWGSLAGPGAAAKRRHRALIRIALGRPLATVAVGGLGLRVDLRDEGVGRPLFVDREYEPAETRFFRSRLGPGMTCVDIGANIGYFATLAAAIVGPRGRVVAFEPDPRNFGLLRANIDRNGLAGRVEARRMALGDAEGELLLRRSAANWGDHRLYGDPGDDREAVAAPVRTLDAVLGEGGSKVDLIKMDVQGFEGHVLRGMARTLGRDRPVVLTEYWPHGIGLAGGSPSGFLAAFERLGYRAHALEADGSLRPVGFGAIDAMVPPIKPACPDHSLINLAFVAGGPPP